jgi:hypothetical protein
VCLRRRVQYTLLVNLDVSQSQTPKERKALCGVLEHLVDNILPGGTRIVIWTFARCAFKEYDARPRKSRELWNWEENIRAQQGIGTYPDRVLQDNLREVQCGIRSGEPTAVVLLWDGDDANPKGTKRRAEELAKLPGLKAIWVVNVPLDSRQDLRSQVEHTFASMGDRLVVSGPYDRAEGFKRFKSLLQRKDER